jgi:hypothetical protein
VRTDYNEAMDVLPKLMMDTDSAQALETPATSLKPTEKEKISVIENFSQG